jgi:hypothetical protein
MECNRSTASITTHSTQFDECVLSDQSQEVSTHLFSYFFLIGKDGNGHNFVSNMDNIGHT